MGAGQEVPVLAAWEEETTEPHTGPTVVSPGPSQEGRGTQG